MARLYRPHIPLPVKVAVAERQMERATGCLPTNEFGVILRDAPKATLRQRLDATLKHLAFIFRCEVKDLRLDHDPPLGARKKTGEGKATVYDPPANSPSHLAYRPHGAQFEGSHDVKTRIRGEHGQFSDIALIKRQRRREKPPTERQARMAKLRKEQKELRRKIARQRKRKAGKAPKHKWQSRPFRSKKSPHRFGGADA